MSDPAPDAPLPIPIPSEDGPRADANAAWNGPEGAPAEPLEPQQALAQAPGANQADAAPGPAGNPPLPEQSVRTRWQRIAARRKLS